MKILVYGGNKRQRALAYSATRFAFANELKLSVYKDASTTLYIRLAKLPTTENHYGLAYHISDSSWRSKNYTIQINTAVAKTSELFLETLMHELVHIWQMANRNLFRYSFNPTRDSYVAFWKGKEYDPDKGYSKQPWERQAYRMETKLAASYKLNK